MSDIFDDDDFAGTTMSLGQIIVGILVLVGLVGIVIVADQSRPAEERTAYRECKESCVKAATPSVDPEKSLQFCLANECSRYLR